MTHEVGATEGGSQSFVEVWGGGQHKAMSWDPRHLERGLGDGQHLLGPAESRTSFHLATVFCLSQGLSFLHHLIC